ncbi:MAG TPA: Lrp/AsnC family transcriptional regulator [Actinomycetes bacterium]|jgi:Lrp/AsnC family transcriptional regulator, leucine-responsive regulatory protein
MDDLDRSIVRLLERHGRLSQEELARRIRLSRPAVHQRVKRLEAARVIRGYRAELDWAALGLPLTAFVWVRTGGPNCAPVGPAILGLGDDGAFVEECHRVIGEWCLLVKARAATPLALQDLIDRVRAVPGVANTITTLALSTLRHEAAADGDPTVGTVAAATMPDE